MEFAVLGSVLVDGQSPSGAIERALLARLLVVPGAPVSAEQLIEAAWPEQRRAGAARSLSVRLAKLRSLVEPDRAPGSPPSVLLREPAGYRLDVAPESVDAQRFLRLAEAAARLPAAAAVADCEQALGLWRGEPFDDLDGVEAAAAEARRLCAARDALRRRRAVGLRELGRADEAVVELERLVAEDPLGEELVRELMLCLYRAGRHAESLDAYRRLTTGLAELGLQPGPGVRELEALVLRHGDELARPQPAAAPSPHPTNVGARVASVIGRERELDAVLACLRDHRIATLVGPGGVGKTTLAAEVARALLERMPGGAWIVDLSALRSSDEVAAAVATSMGLRRVGGHGGDTDRDAIAVLRERLRADAALLVLDGGEHLVPGLGAVASELAAAGAAVSVLVTSRRPLGIPAEAVVPVPSLAVPEADADADDVRRTPAGRLFEQRARAAHPNWRLEGEDVAAVARICRRLDGLPLALELAAARVRALSPTAIAARLEEGLAVLGRGTLDESIESSHALLSADEQEVYRRLSVFESSFALEDAEQVAGGDGLDQADVLELLVALVDHSMVQGEGESPRRYRMLEALRADARARLDPAAADAAARRHATHLAAVAAAAANLVWVEGAEAAGEPLIPLRADLDAAFEYALLAGDADLALQLGAGLAALHHRLGTVPIGVESVEAALTLDGGAPASRLHALWWHIPMLLCELRADDAHGWLERLRELILQHGEAGDQERLQVLVAQVALCAGDIDGARAAAEGLAAAFARRGEPFAAGSVAWTEGAAALVLGDAEHALSLLREARDHYVRCGDICSADGAGADLAQAATLAGREADAAAACEHALRLAPQRPLGERSTHLLHEAALAAARAGDHARAEQLAAAAATAARRDPVVIGPWHAPAAAGDLALMNGDVAGARDRYEQARSLAARVDERSGPSLPVRLYLVASELRLADIAAAGAGPERALEHARAALEHAERAGAPATVLATAAAVRQFEAATAVAAR